MEYLFKEINNANYETCHETCYQLLSELLKSYGIDYNTIIIKKSQYNKPYIDNCNIHFNMSHSKNLCACVVSEKQVGIDIEKIRKVNLNTIHHFATKEETEYILKDEKNIFHRLFEIYTLKEAYFKMYGTNLKDIKKINFISNDQLLLPGYTIKIIKNKDYVISIIEKND